MLLLDLRIDRYTLSETDKLPDRFKNLAHHDLLVDVLREEFQ